MRANGWQRIGVILSVIWAIGAGWYQRAADMAHASLAARALFEICYSDKRPDNPQCVVDSTNAYNASIRESWVRVAVVSLGPILLAWLAAYVVLLVARWIRARFRRA